VTGEAKPSISSVAGSGTGSPTASPVLQMRYVFGGAK